MGQLQQSLVWISRQTAGSTGKLSTRKLWVNHVNFRATLPAGVSRLEPRLSTAALNLVQLRICIRSGAGQRATRPRSAVGAGRRALDRGQLGQLRGSASEGKKRWCSGCAEGHAGAAGVKAKTCEGCQLKRPTSGLPEGKKRWCSGSASRVRARGLTMRPMPARTMDAIAQGGHRDGSGGDGNDTGGC